MSTNQHASAPRPKFDTLFADPRHYRGDCRLMRTAVRRGWLNDAPQADRDALVARFEQATQEREAAGFVSEGQRIRTLFAEVRAAIDLELAGQRAEQGERQIAYFGKRDPVGRPRERWHVSDYPKRIDAKELRRRAEADGTDLRTLRVIDVRPADEPGDPGERVALAVIADAKGGWQVWLICPCCEGRRQHLYPTRAGVRCRKCAGITYADKQQ